MAGQILLLGILGSFVTLTTGDRIWTISIGHEWAGHEYFDSVGYLQGFGLGFIDLVCTAGRMDCRVVQDKYENCWTHNKPGERSSGGRGLMSRWYDGCIGWVPTYERIHTMDFSTPYLKPLPTYFYVKKGSEGNFDATNVSGKKIGFLKGWFQNEQCLARHDGVEGRILKPEQIIIIDLPAGAFDALQSGKVDAVFGSEDTWNNDQRGQVYKFANKEFMCSVGGNGLMTQKGNPIIPQWNVAFSKLKDNGGFKKYCNEANKKHASYGVMECIDK